MFPLLLATTFISKALSILYYSITFRFFYNEQSYCKFKAGKMQYLKILLFSDFYCIYDNVRYNIHIKIKTFLDGIDTEVNINYV